MDLDEAKKVLGTGTEISIPHVLQCFDVKFWVIFENHELQAKLDNLVLSKQTLLRKCVEHEMETKRFFKIAEHSPFKNTCKACKGSGEIYKFLRKTTPIKCKICLGQKEVWVRCNSCNGTTIFQPRPDSKAVTCRTCLKYYEKETDPDKKEEIKGKIPFKCDKCRGSGERFILVRSHEIDTTTPCKRCNELGFIPPKRKPKKPDVRPHKPPKLVANPVLSSEIADKLKQVIPTDPPEEMINPDPEQPSEDK